jgi:hypothetical protein
MVFFGKNDVAFRTVIKILRIELFLKHNGNAALEFYSTRLMVQPIDFVS